MPEKERFKRFPTLVSLSEIAWPLVLLRRLPFSFVYITPAGCHPPISAKQQFFRSVRVFGSDEDRGDVAGRGGEEEGQGDPQEGVRAEAADSASSGRDRRDSRAVRGLEGHF